MTVNNAHETSLTALAHQVSGEVVPLTSGQREIFVAQQLDPANPRFNCGGYLDIGGPRGADSATSPLGKDAAAERRGAPAGKHRADDASGAEATGAAAGERQVTGAADAAAGRASELAGAPSDESAAVQVDLLQRAIRQVAGECQALGVQISVEDGALVQRLGRAEAPLRVMDFSFEAEPMKVAEEWMRADLGRAVSFAEPLFAHALLVVSSERCLFYFRYHHILLDGFGQALYWRRLVDVYGRFERGEEAGPSPFGSLVELATEEQRYLASEQHERERAFWSSALDGAGEPRSLAAQPSFQLARHVFRRQRGQAPEQRGRVHKAAQALQTTWSAVALAAVAAYLHRFTGAEDLVIGLPVRARVGRLALTTPCMLANELPLRLTVRGETTFAALVKQVTAALSALLANQRVRGEELHRARRGAGGETRPPVVVNLVSFDGAMAMGHRTGAIRQLSSGPVRDLQLEIYGGQGGKHLEVCFEGNAECYTAEALAAHQERFLAFLDAAVLGGERAIGELPLVTPGEAARLRAALDGAVRAYPLDRPLHALIAEQARRTPEAIAVLMGGDESDDGGDGRDGRGLRYGELLAKAGQLAAHLRTLGVQRGQLVGVYQERSVELVISLLAILQAGAAYLPLDPELPLHRLELQLEDAGLAVVLTSAALRGQLAHRAVQLVEVDRLLRDAALAAGSTSDSGLGADAGSEVSPDSPAYALYTSGSTGKPKAVLVPHRGIVNRLLWMQEEYRLGADDCVLQKTPFTFDVSVWELFWPLLIGARLVLAEPGQHRDPRALAATIARHGVTTLHFVPPMLELFLAEPAAAPSPSRPSPLRRVICSGEVLRPETVREHFARHGAAVELHNLYGPTEASIDVTYWRCAPEDAGAPIPIGRPVANTQLYLLDGAGRDVPRGAPGELVLGGVQIALGYHNRPELTAERFIDGGARGRLYRTGDLARLRDDGAVEFLGRIDHQVKIRGNRIELGEIEAALRELPAVAQAAVIAAERPGGRGGPLQLVAYVVPAAGAPGPAGPRDAIDPATLPGALLEQLRARLPSALVPAHLLLLTALPLSSSGKLDRHALPRPAVADDEALAGEALAGHASSVTAAPATTADEALLVAAWRKVLRLPATSANVSIDASFFALGGDSMTAIQVRAEVERAGRTFTLAELLQGPTIRALAKVLRPLAAPTLRSRPFGLVSAADRGRLPAGLDDAYPVSAMQAGMLYYASYAERSALYRVVTSTKIAAPFELTALRDAVADLVARHPSLRCSFDLTHFSEPLQLVHRTVEVPVEVVADLRGQSGDEQQRDLAAWIDEAKYARFELAAPPLLRFAVHLCGAATFALSVIEHHAILDGWSDMRMLEELERHYRARLAGQELWLPEIPSTYRDFVAAERRVLADATSREYWMALLRGADGELLPKAAVVTAHRNQRFDVPIAREQSAALRALADREGLPLKALLTAAHLLVLRAFSGRDELVTGVVSSSRLEEAGGDEVIGVFLNTLPLRLDLASAALAGASLLTLAREVFTAEQLAAPHRRYPLPQMYRDLGTELHLDSYVNFMDFHTDRRRALGSRMAVTAGVAETNYPLAVDFLIDPEHQSLLLWLDCDLGALSLAHCERLVGYYQRALAAMAEQPERAVADLDLLSEEERTLIAGWNDTAVSYDRDATVHGAFERWARQTPEAIALAHGGGELSYAELETRASRLADRLRRAGVERGDRVGVNMTRGHELVIALLAVMKAGAAYVPMDPTFPRSRLELIASDAAIACLLVCGGGVENVAAPVTIDLAEAEELASSPAAGAPGAAEKTVASGSGDDLAYVIYTSGSTGRPKGTELRHRNVINFFAGMDRTVRCEPDDVILAVTSVSFDISVLELLWPLARGAKVVIASEGIVHHLTPAERPPADSLGFSLFFFAATSAIGNRDGYHLLLEAARFADAHDFEAIWTPERHFHAFGGLYPNPSVISAALATITKRVGLRCGSVVAPLHDPLRLAEEWALVDNLSGGRVGLAFASGWNANDFALAPERFADRKQVMSQHLDEFRRLWRGGSLRRRNGAGQEVELEVFPKPVQTLPPLWLTSVGSVETFQRAGAAGTNVLTHLLGQSPDELAGKIAAYRQARAAAGHDGPGHVTLMIHTFLGQDASAARRAARAPFREYLRSSTELWRTLFASTGRDLAAGGVPADLDAVIELAIDRYFDTSGLFGSPETCLELVRALEQAGVDELACLIDFGVAVPAAIDGLAWIDKLRRLHLAETAEQQHSFTELIERHGVTLFQGTPSLLSAIAAQPTALAALERARAVLVGGETFPAGLAQRLLTALPKTRVLNMYGPTETTIWSSVHELDPEIDAQASTISIGRPIANTSLIIVNRQGQEVPIGVAGELCIGGDGVAAGYLARPELTADRFVSHPRHGRIYRTGDRAAWRPDGAVELFGRMDRQVKILGHRIEPDEIESVLSRHPEIDSVAVVPRRGQNGTELIAYIAPSRALLADPNIEESYVRHWGEVWQRAYQRDAALTPFAGWNSSYDGRPIPDEQMREWLGHTVERIRTLHPRAIADIGVGVGLVLRELAPHSEQYHGVDLSAAALEAAARSLGDAVPEHVRLEQAGPEYLATLEPHSLDVVVLNSVIQYFPSTAYLERVLADAVRAVRPGGAIFIGDVRSVEMLAEFHTAVQLHRASALLTVEELRTAVERQLQDERELCVSTAFFRQLAAEQPEIGDVRIELKRGRADNELTQFRYDVTLHIGEPTSVAAAAKLGRKDVIDSISFRDLEQTFGVLRQRAGEVATPIAVTGIPNRRLLKISEAARLLHSLPDRSTVWDLERLLWDVDVHAGWHPEDIVSIAKSMGWRAQLVVPDDGRLESFDAVFVPEQE